MLNKKNVLGKQPTELGVKDAVHMAIVSVRAAELIRPGQRCTMNEFNEAVPSKTGPAIADPFLKKNVQRGENLLLLLDQKEIPNVRHDWEHPTLTFGPPTREPVMNATLLQYANDFGVTYKQLMDACAKVAETDTPVPYPGTKTIKELADIQYLDELYDLWSEWAGEVRYKFENNGSDCCPEYDYPEELFQI